MSSPSTPTFNIRSFWNRPEGKTGALVLLLTAVAGVYGVSLILPWLIALLQNTIEAAVLAVALFALLYVIFNKTFQSVLRNVFQLSMRWLTGLVVEIDPIGILQNTVDQMKDNARKLDSAIEGVAGAKKGVEQQIAKNGDAIRHATSIKEQADKQVALSRDPLQKQRYELQRQAQLQEIGRRMKSNDKLNQIYQQTKRMYDLLGRWQQLAEFNIQNTEAEIENARQERKTILAAFRGMGFAQKLIKGDPEQLKMMNASLEFLAEDNANKLGAMEDFARYSEKYLTAMDLEQGASSADAEKMLAEYEQKLLSAGGTQQVPVLMQQYQQAVPVPASNSTVEGDYLDSLK